MLRPRRLLRAGRLDMETRRPRARLLTRRTKGPLPRPGLPDDNNLLWIGAQDRLRPPNRPRSTLGSRKYHRTGCCSWSDGTADANKTVGPRPAASFHRCHYIRTRRKPGLRTVILFKIIKPYGFSNLSFTEFEDNFYLLENDLQR